jgi:6-phospho-beta-glucosidase
VIGRIREADEARRRAPSASPRSVRLLHLAATMGSLPSPYLDYYYFREETLAEARAKSTTRAQDILAGTADYWRHYDEQSRASDPQLDPERSRGGILELELAIDVIDAIVNDRRTVWPVNVPNRGRVLPGFPEDLVVEVPAVVGRAGAEPIAGPPLPANVRGLIEALGSYQALAAEAAWSGGRREALVALTSHPLVGSLPLAERLFDELAAAHRAWLPERLLA